MNVHTSLVSTRTVLKNSLIFANVCLNLWCQLGRLFWKINISIALSQKAIQKESKLFTQKSSGLWHLIYIFRVLRISNLYLFHNGGPYHIETRTMIYMPNKWTGFYMIETFALEELKKSQNAYDTGWIFIFPALWRHEEENEHILLSEEQIADILLDKCF